LQPLQAKAYADLKLLLLLFLRKRSLIFKFLRAFFSVGSSAHRLPQRDVSVEQ
jgi:hypothetical protein